MFRARETPIKDQVPILSEEAQELFENLKLSDQEKEWLNWTPDKLAAEALTGSEYAVRRFRTKLDCNPVVEGVLNNKPDVARRNIQRLSTHLTGGVLDEYFFRHVYKIRENPELQEHIQPVLDELIEAASENLKQYVDRGQPEILDVHYRNFHVFSTTVARLNPALTPSIHKQFSSILGSYGKEHTPFLMLVSLRALGYASNHISEWDEEYVQPWRVDPGSPEGWYRGMSTAAYNAPPTIGWDLAQMNPGEAKYFLREHRTRIERALVEEMERKCCDDPCVNAAWLAARFSKLHLSLHAINGRNAYSRLPLDLARKVKKTAGKVRNKLENTDTVNFDGKDDVGRIARSVESSLRL